MAKMTYEANRVVREVEEEEFVYEFQDPECSNEFDKVCVGYALYNKATANLASELKEKSERERHEMVQKEIERMQEARSLVRFSTGEGRGGQRAAQPLPEVQEVLTQFALNRGKPASMWTKAAELLGFTTEGTWLKAADQRQRLAALIEDNTEIAQAKADVDAAADDEF
jgi:hypothetical protein